MKNLIYITLTALALFSSCSEYASSIEESYDKPDIIIDEILPVIDSTDLKKVATITGEFNAKLTVQQEGSEQFLNGNLNTNITYNEDGHSFRTISIAGNNNILDAEITSVDSLTNLVGNIFYKIQGETEGVVLGRTIEELRNDEYIFSDKQFNRVAHGNSSHYTNVLYTGNTAEINNTRLVKSRKSANFITLNFDEAGLVQNGKIESIGSDGQISFIFNRNGKQINEIYFEHKGNKIGSLILSYDDKINPFTLNHLTKYKTNKSVNSMVLSDLYLDSEQTAEENILSNLPTWLRLKDLSKHNLKSITWNGDILLKQSYSYDNDNYPITTHIKQYFYNNISDLFSSYGNVSVELEGTETITYY
ncbi:MAG: hypothetical protein ACR2MS_10815 [Weeksellaceae bacterium]